MLTLLRRPWKRTETLPLFRGPYALSENLSPLWAPFRIGHWYLFALVHCVGRRCCVVISGRLQQDIVKNVLLNALVGLLGGKTELLLGNWVFDNVRLCCLLDERIMHKQYNTYWMARWLRYHDVVFTLHLQSRRHFFKTGRSLCLHSLFTMIR